MPKSWYDPAKYGPRRRLARPPTSGTRYGNWVSAGESWGGPAQGAGNGQPRRPFKRGNRLSEGRSPRDREAVLKTRQRIEELHDLLYALAFTAEREQTQLQATIHLLDRLGGRPARKARG